MLALVRGAIPLGPCLARPEQDNLDGIKGNITLRGDCYLAREGAPRCIGLCLVVVLNVNLDVGFGKGLSGRRP